MSTSKPIPVRQAIVNVLADGDRLEVTEIYIEVAKTHDVTREIVRDAISKMRHERLLGADTVSLRHYKYFLLDEQPTQIIVPASRFKVPLKLRGPVLSPMAWSMTHLLGAV